jgi:hypothetical protein
MLSLYDINEEDIDGVIDHSQLSTITQPSPLQMQLPILELLKVCVYNVLLFICATHSISNPAYACAVVCIVFFSNTSGVFTDLPSPCWCLLLSRVFYLMILQ